MTCLAGAGSPGWLDGDLFPVLLDWRSLGAGSPGKPAWLVQGVLGDSLGWVATSLSCLTKGSWAQGVLYDLLGWCRES